MYVAKVKVNCEAVSEEIQVSVLFSFLTSVTKKY